MPKAKNVEKKIWDVEEFQVVIKKQDGKDVRGDKKLPNQYTYNNKAKGSFTVAEWKKKRFVTKFSGYDVDVMLSNGDTAKGNNTLSKIRDSYIEDEDE